MIEVERKYLVKNNSYKMQAQRAGLIVQGYLGDNPLSETRIAIRDNHGWLFIKAKGTLSRFERQQEIPLYEAQELLKFCPNIIRKVRYIVYHMGNKWEIDEFLGENEGLDKDNPYLKIETLEGIMKASVGDYIIKGVNGEFYPCKPDIFEKTYERVIDEAD